MAEAYGILLFCTTFTSKEIRIVTSNAAFASRIISLFTRAFNVIPVSSVGTGGRTSLSVSGEKDIEGILVKCGYDSSGFVSLHLNGWLIEKDCCRVSFLRGIFLAGGIIVSPEKKYHLEFITPHASLSREICALLSEYDFNPGINNRGNNYSIYMKASENIEDFLTLCGAPLSAMHLMEAKMLKGVKNNINRRMNFEDANLDKAINASYMQRKAIEKLKAGSAYTVLEDSLREAAELRLENPEASLSELSSISGISRSGLYHKLKKLCSLAEELD